MNAPRPILSLLVATSNQLNSLKLTLGSLQAEPASGDAEILVLDCGDDERTGQFLAAQAKKGAIRRLKSAPDLGRTAARNRMAAAATGRFLLFLDPGVIVSPGWDRALVETLQNDAEVGAVAGKIILTDGRIDHAGLALLQWRQDEVTGEGPADAPRLSGRSIHAGRPADAPGAARAMRVQALAGEGLLVRAEAFAATGGFDETLGARFRADKPLAEADPAGLDLCLRLGAAGWGCVFRPESVLTRLRSVEGDAATGEADADSIALGRIWAGRVEADFDVGGSAGVVPRPHGAIRPYVAPVLALPGRPDADHASVIVLTHNALDYTRVCLRSVLEHTHARHELILVDNGSSDDTVSFLREIQAARPGTRLVLNGENRGFAAGNNQGMALARDGHVVLLNSDTVVTAGWLERLLDAARTNPRAGLFGPVTNNISGMQKLSTVGYDPSTLDGLAAYAAACAAAYAGRVERCLRLTGFALLIRRELLARIGGLDEIFGQGNYEDNDYCLRAALAGYDGLIVRDCFVHHFGGASFRAANVDYDAQIRRQWKIFRKKWEIPEGVAFNTPFDVQGILLGGYDARRHFHPLPASVPELIPERTAQQEPVLRKMEARS